MPAFDLLIGVPFLIGAGLALWRWKRPVFGGLLVAGLAMLAPTVLSEYAPHFRRAVGVTPIAALFIGLGLAVILVARRSLPARTRMCPGGCVKAAWSRMS